MVATAFEGRPFSILARGNVRSPLSGNRDDLVTIGVTKIGKISAVRAHARRILDRRTAIRNAGVVPRLGHFGIAHHKADRAAVGGTRRLAVDGFGDHETSVMPFGEPLRKPRWLIQTT